MTRLLILTTGSYGDHAPYTGLGHALGRHGHEVSLAAVSRFEPLARDAGIGFVPLPDVPATPEVTAQSLRANTGGARGLTALLRLGAEQARRQLPTIVAAAADTEVVAATVATLLYARPVAEAHGLPLIVLPLQPAAPTREFLPPAAGGADLGAFLNHAVAVVGGRLANRAYAPLVREVRQSLGLAPEDDDQAYERMAKLPTLHGFSPTVQPRPHDWAPAAEAVGYWWPVPDPHWQPPVELREFLAAGPPPVFVGFGSMVSEHTARLAEAVADALARTGHRAVIQRGSAELALDAPDVLTVEGVPHEWLLPQVAAAIHHAGAGTAAATLRAGLPSVPVPHSHDQPFWARRLVALGTAPTSIPSKRADGARLASALAQAVGAPSYRHRAGQVAAALAADDAVTPVRRHLESSAPRA